MHIIKRYKNRKFYDTQKSEYVNLEEIEALIKNTEDLIVVDHLGNDITGKTMLSIIANKKENESDILILKKIIRQNDSLFGYLSAIKEITEQYK